MEKAFETFHLSTDCQLYPNENSIYPAFYSTLLTSPVARIDLSYIIDTWTALCSPSYDLVSKAQ